MSPSVRACLVLAALASACSAPAPQVLAQDLFSPTDLAATGDRVAYTLADGEVAWVSRDGAQRGTIAPPAFTPAPNQIPVEPDAIDVAIGDTAIAWTGHDPTATLWTAPLAGGAPVLRESLALGYYQDVAWRGERLCWLTSTEVRCADHAGDAPRRIAFAANPRALALTDDAVWWLEAGLDPGRSHDGRLVTAPLAGGAPSVVASLLDDPTELAIAGDQVFWIDRGSCTEGSGGCVRDHDAALRRIARAGGAAITQSGGHGDIHGLAVRGDGVFFCADGDVWRAAGLGADPVDDSPDCFALAAGDADLYLAGIDRITRVAAP